MPEITCTECEKKFRTVKRFPHRTDCPNCKASVVYAGETSVDERVRDGSGVTAHGSPARIESTSQSNRALRGATSHNQEGVRLFQAKNYADAITEFTKAIDLYPGFTSAFRNRAQAYQKLGMEEAAKTDLETVTSKEREIQPHAATPEVHMPTNDEKDSNRIIFGVLWLVGGGIASLVTYNLADAGGTYFVFWGAILWGEYQILRGLYEL